jgi:hypothetical protein
MDLKKECRLIVMQIRVLRKMLGLKVNEKTRR